MMKTATTLLFNIVVLCTPSLISGVSLRVTIKTTRCGLYPSYGSLYIDVVGTIKSESGVSLGSYSTSAQTINKAVDLNVGRIKRIFVYNTVAPHLHLDNIQITDTSTSLRYTFRCQCRITKGNRQEIKSEECYYDEPIDNCQTIPEKVECHIGRCKQCDDGYFINGNVCSACRSITNCRTTLCNSLTDRWCTQCRDADLFKLDNDGRSCARTCSWEDRWCWPGTCGSPDTHNYARDCDCEDTSFTRVYDTTQVKCELTRSPRVLTCRMQVIDNNNDVRMSHVPPGQPTNCSNQQDFYGNIQVKQVVTNATFDFLVDVSHLNAVKPLFVNESTFGVTDVYFYIVKKSISGSEISTKFPIREDSDSSNPETLVSYDRVMNNSVSNGDMENGQRLCLRLAVQGGGYMVSRNVQTHSMYSVPYPKTDTSRDVCYWYDDATPRHCREDTTCSTEPLDTTSRILTRRDFTVTFTGWEDPSPVIGDSKFASGIHTYVINLYEIKESGTDFLDMDRIPVIPAISQTSPVDVSIPPDLPNPAMYAVVLEVKDVANNVQQARRFVMFDNSSIVLARDDRPIYSTTTSVETDNKWQTNLGNICYSWIDRYYNDKFYHLNMLKPIKQDYHGLISGVYEQTSGILPVSGTENVHGITMFHYTLRRDEQVIISETEVPNFTSQTLCVSPTLTDGETYRVEIVAEDVMTHTYIESLSSHIDASRPEIVNLWLVKDGYKRLFVHNSSDLSKMILTFDTLDIHSGIYAVDWSLGTTFGGKDIGQGSLGVQRLESNTSCPQEALTCYCPSVGPCSYFNYTLALNSLVHSNTHNGNHNRQYHFTITSTNVARLVYIEHLEVFADDSPPTPGVVMEGSAGAPDIDYTNEESVIVNGLGSLTTRVG